MEAGGGEEEALEVQGDICVMDGGVLKMREIKDS